MHLKIAIELRNKLPKLFGKNRLGRFWAFKYDSSLGRGINIHADFAAINLNFWITPDEFNNNKKGGGLKVYDTPAPQNWTFKKYNINAQEIYKLLKKDKALKKIIKKTSFINVGTGIEHSVKFFVQRIQKIVNPNTKIKFNPKFPDGTPRKLLNSQIIRKLGWRPKTSLDEGLIRAYDWYLKNYKK